MVALRKWPKTINAQNKLGQTATHIAMGWPAGLRLLLLHGANANKFDISGLIPLHYGIYKGFAEGVGILINEGCNVNDHRHHRSEFIPRNPLIVAVQNIRKDIFSNRISAPSYESRWSVLQTLISSLAAQQHKINHASAVLKDSGLLTPDPYALGANRGTVYHIPNLNVTVAEELWQAGFHDIDAPDKFGRTPVTVPRIRMVYDCRDLKVELQLISWFINRGANLGCIFDKSTTSNLPISSRRASYFLGSNIGLLVRKRCTIWIRYPSRSSFSREWWPTSFSQLDENCMYTLADVLSDHHHDHCSCACTSQGLSVGN